MPTMSEWADELGEVTAWVSAWEGSGEDVKTENRERCRAIITGAWWAIIGDETMPAVNAVPGADQLANDLRSARDALRKWDRLGPAERSTQKTFIRGVLARALRFFAPPKR